MYCTKCGTKIYEGDSFCRHCGTKSPQAESEDVINANEMQETAAPIEEATRANSFEIMPDADLDRNYDVPPIEEVEDEKPVSLFPEISDGFPDPTQGGLMDVASNATETDRVTTTAYTTQADGVTGSPTQTAVSGNFYRDSAVNNSNSHDGNYAAYSYGGGQSNSTVSVFKKSVSEEKVFFGKSAFVLCLIIIGLLSTACGVLAGLYFNI